MRTCKDLISTWGTQQMADAMGVQYTVVASWKDRNQIPYNYFPRIVARAGADGIAGISYEFLFSLQRGRSALAKSAKPKKKPSLRARTAA